MKKFFGGCLIVLIAACFSVALNISLASCKNSPVAKFVNPTIDKAQVSLCVDSLVNPVFGEFSDVQELKQQMITARYTDSVFLSIPDKTLKDVYTVLSKKKLYIHKDDIVAEFNNNRGIYENLPPNSSGDVSNTMSSTTTTTPLAPGIVREETTTVMEAPPTRVVSKPAGSYKDTVIDGKKAIIED